MIPRLRIWDKKNEKMIYAGELYLFVFGYYKEDVWVHDVGMSHNILTRDIMQSSGIKDKNSVEIYEGDVLSLSYRGFVFEIASVTFDRGAFWIYYHGTDDKELLYDALDGVELTIIGNIYEGF